MVDHERHRQPPQGLVGKVALRPPDPVFVARIGIVVPTHRAQDPHGHAGEKAIVEPCDTQVVLVKSETLSGRQVSPIPAPKGKVQGRPHGALVDAEVEGRAVGALPLLGFPPEITTLGPPGQGRAEGVGDSHAGVVDKITDPWRVIIEIGINIFPENRCPGIETIGIAGPGAVAGKVREEVVKTCHIGIFQNDPVVDGEPVGEAGSHAVQPDCTHGRVLAMIIVIRVIEFDKVFPTKLIDQGGRYNITEISVPVLADRRVIDSRRLGLLRGGYVSLQRIF